MSRPMPKIQLGSELDFTNLSTVQPNHLSQISPNPDASIFNSTQFGRRFKFAPTMTDTLQVEDVNSSHHHAVMNSGLLRNHDPASSRVNLNQTHTNRSIFHTPMQLDEALAGAGGLGSQSYIHSARPTYRNSMDMSMANQLNSARLPAGRDANRSVAGVGNESVVDKQHEIMDRILGNVEDYKKLEYMKKRVALEPLLGKSDAFSSLMQSMRSPAQNTSQSHFLLQSPQTSLLHSPIQSSRMGNPSVLSMSPMPMYTSPIHEPSHFDILAESDIIDVENLDKNSNSVLRNLKPGLDPMKTRDPRQSIFERYNTRSRGAPAKKSQFDILEHSHAGTDDSMMRTTRTFNPSSVMLNKAKSREYPLSGKEMVRVYGWGLLFPHILAKKAGVNLKKNPSRASIKSMNINRGLQENDLTVPEYLKKFIAFAAGAVEKEIKKLVTSQDQMTLVVGPTDKTSVNMEKSCKRITEHLMDIIDNLTVQLSNGRLSPEFYWYWASMTENEGVLPEPVLSGFEVDRLAFGNSGDLKQMTRQKSKLALATFILIRGLLTFLIMRPWVAIPSLQETNVNFNNMINAGSVLYHAVFEVIEENVQKSGGPKGTMRGQQPIFSAVDPSNLGRVDAIPDDNADDAQEITSGFYKKDYLAGYFKERPKMLKKLKESIVDFLEVFYTRTHKMYECKKLGK